MAANRLTRVTSLAILAVLGCGAAYYAGTRMVKPRMPPCPDPVHTERAPLAVAVADLDLGAVWESSGHVVRLPVHNCTADTVHVGAYRITQEVREEGDRISKVLFLICTDDKPAARVWVEIVYRGEPRDWIGRAIGGLRP
jgi:hypothetical protein